MEQADFLTAGQMAKIHGLNKQTLQYYDSISLFSPVLRSPFGYRLYSPLQSTQLQAILFFRNLNIPISTIKKYMNFF